MTEEKEGNLVGLAVALIAVAFFVGLVLGMTHNYKTELERCVTRREATICEEVQPKRVPKVPLKDGSYLRVAP